MTEKEDKTEETERTPKNADDMAVSARSLLASLSDMGYTKDETICILAMASALLNGEIFISKMLESATVVKVPVQMPWTQKSSLN